MRNKKGIEMSFAWLFSLIAGAIILFLAIFIATKFASQGQYQLDTTTAKTLDVLLNPLQTSIESGKVTSMNLASETKIYNDCDNLGDFGTQYISIAQQTGFLKEFPEPAQKVSFHGKYIFSDGIIQGKKFYVFADSFEFPFKVASPIILLSSEKSYYFVNAPDNIKNYLERLESQKVIDIFYFGQHPENSVKVCFGSNLPESEREKCDVLVVGTCNSSDCENEYDEGIIKKDGRQMNYVGNALMYSVIFSDKDVYECQTKRLMQRVSQLSNVYKDQSQIISLKNCNTNLENDLSLLSSFAKNFKDSSDLNVMNVQVKELKNKNEGLQSQCRLW